MDHLLFFLDLDVEDHINKYPFKLIHSWLELDSFNSLVSRLGKNCYGFICFSNMDSLVRKLMELKMVVIEWEKKREVELKEELISLKKEYEQISQYFISSNFSVEINHRMSSLEAKKLQILILEKEMHEIW